jgi:hypothetical protein
MPCRRRLAKGKSDAFGHAALVQFEPALIGERQRKGNAQAMQASSCTPERDGYVGYSGVNARSGNRIA